jgi:hypothetical protein
MSLAGFCFAGKAPTSTDTKRWLLVVLTEHAEHRR